MYWVYHWRQAFCIRFSDFWCHPWLQRLLWALVPFQSLQIHYGWGQAGFNPEKQTPIWWTLESGRHVVSITVTLGTAVWSSNISNSQNLLMKNQRFLTIALLFFNSLSGIAGGGALIVDPGGGLIGMPVRIRRRAGDAQNLGRKRFHSQRDR